MRVDLHLHTTASDGTESPSQVVRRAAERGIDVIAVTDHDTVAGIAEARSALTARQRLIPAIEMSCSIGGEVNFRCHVLGYGIDEEHPAIKDAIKLGSTKRAVKLLRRIEYLRRDFGIELTDGELAWLHSRGSASRLHLANILVDRGLVRSTDEAVDRYLDYSGLPDDRIEAEIAIRAISEAGGIAVWAHPLGGERERRIGAEELLKCARILKSMGIRGLEAYYSRYTEADRQTVLEAARELGLLVSAGSDYHGENKTVELGRLGAEGKAVDAASVTVLRALGVL